MYAIMPDKNTPEIINQFLFDNLVFKNGEYLPPYSAPTSQYLDVDAWKNPNDERRLFYVTDEISAVAAGCEPLVAALAVQYTREQLRPMGWFNGAFE